MKLAVKENLSYNEARKQCETTNRLTKLDKTEMQNQMKKLRIKMEAATHSMQVPQQPSTRAAQRTIKELKEVQ